MLEPCFWVVERSTDGRVFARSVCYLDFWSLPLLDRDLFHFRLEEAVELGGSNQVGLQLMPMPTVKPTTCSCNTQFYGSLWATVGWAANDGLEEEVMALVEAVADEGFRTFSQGSKSASIAPIVGRGSQPSIMFWQISQSHTSVRWRLYQWACLHPENSGAGYPKWSSMAHNHRLERKREKWHNNAGSW